MGGEESYILTETRASSQRTWKVAETPGEAGLTVQLSPQGAQPGTSTSSGHTGAEVTPTDAETELRSDLTVLTD